MKFGVNDVVAFASIGATEFGVSVLTPDARPLRVLLGLLLGGAASFAFRFLPAIALFLEA